jgi:hypothetical protein
MRTPNTPVREITNIVLPADGDSLTANDCLGWASPGVDIVNSQDSTVLNRFSEEPGQHQSCCSTTDDRQDLADARYTNW